MIKHIIIISAYNTISNLECSLKTFTIVLVVISSKLNSIIFLSAIIILSLFTYALFIIDGINNILIIITALIIIVITCNILEQIEIVLLTIFNFFCFSLLNFTTLIFTSSSNESKSKILSLTKSFNLQWNILQSSNILFISGYAVPFSHFETLCLDTPIFSANFSWLIFCFFLKLYKFSPNFIRCSSFQVQF